MVNTFIKQAVYLSRRLPIECLNIQETYMHIEFTDLYELTITYDDEGEFTLNAYAGDKIIFSKRSSHLRLIVRESCIRLKEERKRWDDLPF